MSAMVCGEFHFSYEAFVTRLTFEWSFFCKHLKNSIFSRNYFSDENSPAWVRRCKVRYHLRVKPLAHVSHLKGFSPAKILKSQFSPEFISRIAGRTSVVTYRCGSSCVRSYYLFDWIPCNTLDSSEFPILEMWTNDNEPIDIKSFRIKFYLVECLVKYYEMRSCFLLDANYSLRHLPHWALNHAPESRPQFLKKKLKRNAQTFLTWAKLKSAEFSATLQPKQLNHTNQKEV